ncbi:processed acidic surface protein [Fredinandcohnia humi]
MKKFFIIGFMCVIQLTFFANFSFAKVAKVDLENFTKETGITEEKLADYLSVYDLSLNDFESVNELVAYLGEPITQNTLHTLLSKHNISEDELNNILGGLGETVNDYLFIKDLDTTVSFYLNHAEVLVEAERMLSEIGLNEDEIDSLFMHFLSLNDVNLEQQMNSINANLEQYFSYNESANLTSNQRKELLGIYDRMIELFELNPKYYLLKNSSKQAIAYNELVEMDTLDGADLLIELYRQNDEFLLDLRVSEEMLASDFIIERGEKLLTVATLATEMSISVYGNRLPDTASPNANILLLGVILVVFGIIALFVTKKIQKI